MNSGKAETFLGEGAKAHLIWVFSETTDHERGASSLYPEDWACIDRFGRVRNTFKSIHKRQPKETETLEPVTMMMDHRAEGFTRVRLITYQNFIDHC